MKKHLVVYTRSGGTWAELVNGRYIGRVTTASVVKAMKRPLKNHVYAMRYYTR